MSRRKENAVSVYWYWSDTHTNEDRKVKDRKVKPEEQKGAKKVWYFRTTIEFADGSRKRVSGTPGVVGPYQDLDNSSGDAQKAEDRAKREAMFGKPKIETVEAPQAQAMTLAEYAPVFVENYAPRDDKPRSRSSRDQILKAQLIPNFGSMAMDSIIQSDVDAFVKARRRSGVTRSGVTKKTVNNELGVLSAILGYAAENKLIAPTSLHLMVADKSSKDRPIVPVKEADIAKLVSAATDPRYRAAILLAAEAGLRIGEIRGLKWADTAEDKLTVRRAIDTHNNVTTPKSGFRRIIPISDGLAGALLAVPRRGEYVVARKDGRALGYDALREKIHAIYQAAGVKVPESETGKTMPFHSLRHTFGTVCATRGVPVPTIQLLMGHEDVSTTMRYIAVSEAEKENAIDRAFGRKPRGLSEDVRGFGRNGAVSESSTVN